MSSLRRIRSSRANGARSRGPVSPEGKRQSSLNALRHGFLAKTVVLPGEVGDAFDSLVDQHCARFGPLDGVEFGMIEEMASSYWRLRRAWAIENRLLSGAMAGEPEGDDLGRLTTAYRQLAATPELHLLHRYETRLHLMYHRALRDLVLLRAAGTPDGLNPTETNLVQEDDTGEVPGE